MQKLGTLTQKISFNCMRKINEQIDFGSPTKFGNLFLNRDIVSSDELKATIICQTGSRIVSFKKNSALKSSKIKCMLENNAEELSDAEEDDELCPVDCVREFWTDEEFSRIIENATEDNALVVVDFYRTSCGSCKYIEQGFAKLCKGSGNEEAPVIFLKHNVLDEYDERSEVAERLRIRSVPLFHFYKNEYYWKHLQPEIKSEYCSHS